ncbi:hypothetical protein JCM9957A_03220 [Kineosporia succinea]
MRQLDLEHGPGRHREQLRLLSPDLHDERQDVETAPRAAPSEALGELGVAHVQGIADDPAVGPAVARVAQQLRVPDPDLLAGR